LPTPRHSIDRPANTAHAPHARDLFRMLNARAQRLALNDDAGVTQGLAASASAMIADALCRLHVAEAAHDEHAAPAATPESFPTATTPHRLRLVRGDDHPH
jgi:hypothetical protein